jgi:hypothetical protein
VYVLPLAAYATLATSSFAAFSHAREAPFGVGASALVLLFIGIRNAWDSVAYLVTKLSAEADKSPEKEKR